MWVYAFRAHIASRRLVVYLNRKFPVFISSNDYESKFVPISNLFFSDLLSSFLFMRISLHKNWNVSTHIKSPRYAITHGCLNFNADSSIQYSEIREERDADPLCSWLLNICCRQSVTVRRSNYIGLAQILSNSVVFLRRPWIDNSHERRGKSLWEVNHMYLRGHSKWEQKDPNYVF